MKNKAVILPSINSSPAINTFVSMWDSYYLHIQTHVPGREGSHRLWLHQDWFVYYSIKVWERCSWYCLNNKNALKPYLEIRWSGNSAHQQQPLHPSQDKWADQVKANCYATQAEKPSPLGKQLRGKKSIAPKIWQLCSCWGARGMDNKVSNLSTTPLFSRMDLKNRG